MGSATSFDDLTRLVGATTSRRQVLRVAVGSATLALSGLVGFAPRRAEAATPLTENDACKALQTRIGSAAFSVALKPGTCPDFSHEVDLGVICSDGVRKPSWEGCTVADFIASGSSVLNPPKITRVPKHHPTQWCVAWTVHVGWADPAPRTTILDWSPSPGSTCCPGECPDLDRYRTDICSHETLHVMDAERIVQTARTKWASRDFNVCFDDQKTAKSFAKFSNDLTAVTWNNFVRQQVTLEAQTMKEEFDKRDATGHFIARPNCEICKAPDVQHSCCNNICTNTQSDPSNCGSCGVVCPFGQACVDGRCVGCRIDETPCGAGCCPAGTECCDPSCINCCPVGSCQTRPDGSHCCLYPMGICASC
jgi:hypothetical protein